VALKNGEKHEIEFPSAIEEKRYTNWNPDSHQHRLPAYGAGCQGSFKSYQILTHLVISGPDPAKKS